MHRWDDIKHKGPRCFPCAQCGLPDYAGSWEGVPACGIAKCKRCVGIDIGAAIMAGIIALGTWAQNIEIERWKTRDRNVRLTYKCPECSSRIGTKRAC